MGTTDFGMVGSNILNFTDLNNANVSMSILVYDLPMGNTSSQINTTSVSGLPPPEITDECRLLSQSYDKLNETVALDIVGECNSLGKYSKVKYLILATEKELIITSFQANSDELYETNLAKFNKSLDSIKIENPVDIRKVLENFTL